MASEKIKAMSKSELKDKIHEFNHMIMEEFLQQEHLSNYTLSQYESALSIFFTWVHDYCSNKAIHELKPRDALKYQNYLIRNGLSSSSVRFKRSAVSSLCNYIEVYYLEDFPTFRNIYSKAIPNPAKVAKHEKQPLTKEEYSILIEELEKREEWQILAYLKFTYSSGCRKSESHQIPKEIATYNKVKDKDGNEKSFYLTPKIRTKGKGKVGNVRALKFDDSAMQAIKKWLEIRGEDDCEFLFVKKNKDGATRQVSKSTFNRWASEIFSKIVGRRVYPHLIRSTRATHLVVEDGKDIKTAQSVLGHKDSSTTEIYVIRDDSEDADDAFE